jgi:addiction module RelB/DinJ family antitoxin
MQTTNINFKTPLETKKKFEEFCDKIGLNTSTALNLVMRSAIETGELPVKLKLENTNKAAKALFDFYIKHPKPLINMTDEEGDMYVKSFRSKK